MRDSNPRPSRCKRDALPAELIALKTLAVIISIAGNITTV